MTLLLHKVGLLSCSSLNISHKLRVAICHPLLAKFLSISAEPKSNFHVKAICDSFRRGFSWDRLSKQFSAVNLNDSIVEKVLLELKEPNDAKCALGFFHWSARMKDYQHNVWSYCITIHILVQAGLLIDARILIESVLKKCKEDTSKFKVVDLLVASYKVVVSTPLVFDLLVQGYAKLRMFEIAFDVSRYLEEKGFSLSLLSYNTMIYIVEKSCKYYMVWSIYEYMLENIRYPNEVTIKTMIDALCKEGRLQIYAETVERIHGKRCSPSIIVNTSLLIRIMDERRTEVGMTLLKRMLQKNMILDTVAYSLIVYAKLQLGNLESALEVYEQMINRGFTSNSFVVTAFMRAYFSVGKIDKVYCLMQEMENTGLKPYDETYNVLMVGSAKVHRVEESVSYCERMMGQGLLPSCSAFNEMAEKLCNVGGADQANKLLTVLIEKGFVPNETTYAHLIAGYAKQGSLQEVLKLYYEMEYRSLPPSLSVFVSLIQILCKCGKLQEADKYLRIMKNRSLVLDADAYKLLITSNLEKGSKERAVELYEEMRSKGMKPSDSFCIGARLEKG